jgi:hypothetical protein
MHDDNKRARAAKIDVKLLIYQSKDGVYSP